MNSIIFGRKIIFIVDRLEKCRIYSGVNKRMEKAFNFLHEYRKKELPKGRYEIDGEEIYALVQTYRTKPSEEKK